jgi:hypothetical protein
MSGLWAWPLTDPLRMFDKLGLGATPIEKADTRQRRVSVCHQAVICLAISWKNAMCSWSR